MTNKKTAATILAVLCSIAIYGQSSSVQKPLKIKAIFPAGEEVATSNRIAIKFNQNILTWDASKFEDDVVPIDIEPVVECEWKWIDLDTLLCELPADTGLNAATSYKVIVLPNIKFPNGHELENEYVHTFKTTWPTIKSVKLTAWMSPTQPIIEVCFDHDTSLDSLQNKILLHDSSSLHSFPVSVWPSSRKLTNSLTDDYFGLLQKYLQFDHLDQSTDGSSSSDCVLLLPREHLPPATNVSLLLLPSVAEALEDVLTAERVLVDTNVSTIGEFHLLGLVCQDVHDEEIFLTEDDPIDSTCDPNSNFAVVFSSPVKLSVDRFIHTDPPLPRKNSDDRFNFGQFRRAMDSFEDRGFQLSFQREFKPSTTYRLYVVPSRQGHENPKTSDPIQDGFGRHLVGTNEITFRTANASAVTSLGKSAVAVNSKGTVEPNLYTRNVEDVVVDYVILDEKGEQRDLTMSKPSPNLDDILHSQELGFRTNLRSSSGAMIGTVTSRDRFGRQEERIQDSFFVQATPYSVFLKVRDFRALVWVVDLQTGEPITGATVEFFQGSPIDYSDSLDPILSAITDKNGLVSFQSPQAIDVHWRSDEKYFVRVEGAEGIALLPVGWYFELEDLYLPETAVDTVDHWSTTSQPIYEPGETVQIKGFVRNRRDGARVIPQHGYFALCVSQPRGLKYEVNEISLNQFGAYHASLQLSKQTQIGTYYLDLIFSPTQPVIEPCSYTYDEKNYDAPGVYVVEGDSFEVSELNTNPVQVSQVLNSDSFERGESMSILIQSEFYAGGPNSYGNGSIDVYLSPSPPPIEIVDIEQYEFSGIELEPSSTFWDTTRIELDFELDKDGKFLMTIDPLDHGMYFGTYRIESLVGSNQGKTAAALDAVDYWGVDQFVGIRQPVEDVFARYDEWSVTKFKVNEPWPVKVLVVSKEDEIVVGKDIQISIFLRGEEISFRKYEWNLVFECELVSELDPVACDFTPTDEGHYRIEAQIVDTKGFSHRSTVLAEAVTAANREDFSDDPDKLLLSCDANVVNVGDLVRCEVDNHLGRAPSLVTVEHDGVIDQWLVRLDPANPRFEFRVREDYIPSFSLSVLAQSPRSLTSSSLDNLFRIGTAEFTFQYPHSPSKQLDIEVSSDRELYHFGDLGSLKLSTTNKQEKAIPVEYTVAILDKTLLDYRTTRDRREEFMSLPIYHDFMIQEIASETETSYFDPTRKSWHFTENGAYTYGLVASLMEQSTVPVTTNESNNHRYFGSGYSGFGRYPRVSWSNGLEFSSLHEVKKWVAYWNPSVISSQGQTQLDFELPDRNTSWKVMVLAVSADDRFGFATTTFESTKDIEVRAVQPRVVTESDSFQVGVSIRNRTERRRTTTVELNASGALASESNTKLRQRVSLKPFETKSLTLDVKADVVPMKINQTTDPVEIRVLASVGNRDKKDELDLRIPVRRNRVLVSNVVYGAIENDSTSLPIELPSRPNIDDLQLNLTLTTSDTTNLNGVFRVVSDESYSHWETKLSQAVLAMQYLQLDGQDKTHGIQTSDALQLIVKVLDSANNYQKESGGMAQFVARNSDECPYLSAYTALAFRWLEDAGYDVPETVDRKLRDYLRAYFSRRESFNPDYSWVSDNNVVNQLKTTNGAVMLHALALAGELTETELIDFSNRIEQLDLFGLSHYLLATLKLNSTHPLNTKIVERIMAHLSEVDESLEFVESVPYEFAVILHSESRSLCSLLEALTKYSQANLNRIDMGLLRELSNTVRYARHDSPYWSNMQENVFCTNALISFFEINNSETSALEATIDLRSDKSNVSMRLAEAWRLNKSKPGLHTTHMLNEHRFGPNNTLEITRIGNGTALFELELSYLTSLNERINRYSGFEVHREYVVLRDKQWLVLDPGQHVNIGELVLVNLYLNTKIDRHHIMLEDSIPGGLEPVAIDDDGSGRDSIFYFIPEVREDLPNSQWQEEYSDSEAWRGDWFRYSEIGTQNVVFFDDFTRRGKYQTSWIGRAITAGEFTVFPTHVEEKYRPYMFSKSEPWVLNVKP